MGRNFDSEKYSKVLNSCDLIKDLKLMNDEDETLVGDRGITLSGGQKARINLARAVYGSSDILLLDDPLSAVDAEVANHIFDECIKTLLKGKTVVLATHQIQYLSQSDKILVLEAGNMVFFGSYKKLKKRDDILNLIGSDAKIKEKLKKTDKIDEKVEKIHQILIVEEEEITGSQVKFSSYIRYTKLGFRSLYFFGFILFIMCISQAVFQYAIY